MHVIDIQDLGKTYRIPKHGEGWRGKLRSLVRTEYIDKEAIRDVSFSVEPGEMLGFIGPNGAGKSTLIKMLVGIMPPTLGRVRVKGVNPFAKRRDFTRRIGVVFGQRNALWWDLPVRDSFEMLRRIYGVSPAAYRDRVGYLTDTFELLPMLYRPVRTLSLGEKLRCNIAAAMLHSPDVLFLDEPTIGLDVLAVDQLLDALRKVNDEQKTTVFLTTHDMGVVEQLCRRMLLLYQGRILFDGTFAEALRTYASYRRVRIALADPSGLDRLVERLPASLKLEQTRAGQAQLLFQEAELSYDELFAHLRDLMSDRAFDVIDLCLEKPDLNEIILTMFYRFQRESA